MIYDKRSDCVPSMILYIMNMIYITYHMAIAVVFRFSSENISATAFINSQYFFVQISF